MWKVVFFFLFFITKLAVIYQTPYRMNWGNGWLGISRNQASADLNSKYVNAWIQRFKSVRGKQIECESNVKSIPVPCVVKLSENREKNKTKQSSVKSLAELCDLSIFCLM